MRQITYDPALATPGTLLRNRLAALCLGTADARLRPSISDPFGSNDPFVGVLDLLPSDQAPGDAEVPLALVSLSPEGGIRFIDQWSVRRRSSARSQDERWGRFVDDSRLAVGQATFLQFQEHLEAIRTGARPHEAPVHDHFEYLPPVGVVPLRHDGRPGFVSPTFFGDIPVRDAEIYLEGSSVEALVRESFGYPAIDLTGRAANPRQLEMVWVYRVRENRQPSPAPVPYVVFASGHIPPRGLPRVDVARASFSTLL